VIDNATLDLGRGTARSSFAGRAGKLAALVWLIPGGLAVAYVVEFIVHFSHNMWVLGWISDYAFTYTSPEELVSTGMGGHMFLGTYGMYVQLWFGMLTARLPLHHQLWLIAPKAVYVGAAALVGWSVTQLANRRAGVLAVVLACACSPFALGTFMAPAVHNTTYPGIALLGAYLLWLTKGAARQRAIAIAVPLLVSIVIGVSFASDDLLVPTGILPFFLTAVLALTRRDRQSKRVALTAIATVLAAVPIAWLTSTIMASLGYGTEVQSLTLTPLSLLHTHFNLLIFGLKLLFNGYLGVLAPGVMHTPLGFACDVFASLALLAMFVYGARAALELVCSGRQEEHREDGPRSLVRLRVNLHVIFWSCSAAMACGAYLLSDYYDSDHRAFYASTLLAVGAIVPLFAVAASRLRWLVPIGASIFITASLIGLVLEYNVVRFYTVLPGYQPEIERLAESNHVTVGYASYGGATSLTFNSHKRLIVRPVAPCPGAIEVNICRGGHFTMDSWYVPRARHSFVLVEPNFTPVGNLTVRPTGLGRPLASYQVGPIEMYVYPYDVASRIKRLPE
jgi:hypothetical protein